MLPGVDRVGAARRARDATPISAVKPLFDAAGLVIAKWNEPSAAFAWMSFQVTFGLFAQPKRLRDGLLHADDDRAEHDLLLTPRSCWPASGSSDRYLPWLNQAASLVSPSAIFSAPSSVPM